MSLFIIDIFLQGNLYLEVLGVEVLEYGNDCVVMVLKFKFEFMNSWYVVQGGISMILLDVVMGLLVCVGAFDVKFFVIVEMSISFLQLVGYVGDIIIVCGYIYYCFIIMCFCQVELFNGDCLVVKVMGIFKLICCLDILCKLDQE